MAAKRTNSLRLAKNDTRGDKPAALHPTKIDIPARTRQAVIELLQARLVDGVDLHSQCKQAHWNVKGPGFIAVHELFDQVATAADGWVDLIAERIMQLGGTAYGTVRVAAARSSLDEYPLHIVAQREHIKALTSALAAFGAAVRAAIDTADDEEDAGTADLFTGISREVDKLRWFVESHDQGA